MRPLDPLTLPLHGQILIEASAGTGKTYTIALLFLRLLLEYGLSVDKILVVTFTNAAAEELRGRIRQRIRDALDVLEDRGPDDPLLHKLLAGNGTQDRAAVLLHDALTRMDEAAVYTIHSFCRRMLQEHAFESGAPFEMEFLESEQLLRQRIMEDFWRQRLYPASRKETAWAKAVWESPGSLLAGLGGHLGRAEADCIPVISREDIEQQAEALKPLFLTMQADWRQCREEVAELLRNNKRLSRNNSSGYGLKRLATALKALDRFVEPADEMPWSVTKELELFTAEKIGSTLKKNKHEPPEHPFFAVFENFLRAHRQLMQSRRISLLFEARKYLYNELVRRKKEQNQLSFDDLLTCLAQGLEEPEGGELAVGIGRRFPVIIVDEFQDTDPLQYRIFRAVHDAAYRKDAFSRKENRTVGLFLIGDPKQAIYSFRGVDIFTYLQAHADTPRDNRLTMTTNYRSGSAMVRAVNRLFNHEAPFLFREIDFPEVKADDKVDSTPFLVDNKPPPWALTCLLLPEGVRGALSKAAAEDQAARFCAHEIAALLAAGFAERAKIGAHPLSAGDIAILVRTHAEAALIRRELNRFGIIAVCSGQESVFSTQEAEQLRTLMTSLHDLSDSALVRTVLAGDLFGYTAEQLDRLRSDEQEWEQVIKTMSDYRQLWQDQGFLPMFQRLLNEQRTVSRLNACPAGERILTNFLHLAELIQEAGRRQAGADALLRWFCDRIHCPEEQAENQQLRLESDEHLVRIATVHKAKGMEYPIVFLPFLWHGRSLLKGGNRKEGEDPFAFHRPGQPDRLCIDLGSNREEHLARAEQERLAEDLRLLYVALTRARYSCFFCWGRIKEMEQSALCYLLHGDDLSLERIVADLDRAGIPVKPYPEESFRPVPEAEQAPARLRAVSFSRRIDTGWQITSYSGLVASQEDRPEQPDYDIYDQFANKENKENETVGSDVFGFPKGPAAGTFLHAILEQISFTGSAGHEEEIRNQLARAGFAEHWLPVVNAWMGAVLHTELEGKDGRFSLSCLPVRERINEMAFYFPLESTRPDRFNRILREFGYASLPPARSVALKGLMTGFIDLVFRLQGRYYLADYKSNHLGSRTVDYHPDRLEEAMLDHRYDLQYLIYILALHRFLSVRIQGYEYEHHFGGVFYLFLRGMNPSYPNGTGVFTTCPPFALIDSLDQCCAGRQH